MTELGVAWAIIYGVTALLLLLAAALIFIALRMMWGDGRAGRLWAVVTVVLPVVVVWAAWTIKGSQS